MSLVHPLEDPEDSDEVKHARYLVQQYSDEVSSARYLVQQHGDEVRWTEVSSDDANNRYTRNSNQVRIQPVV